jgi:hypothetical protein
VQIAPGMMSCRFTQHLSRALLGGCPPGRLAPPQPAVTQGEAPEQARLRGRLHSAIARVSV